MPFTLAHTAVTLPFLKIPKRFVSLTGLAVGSMSPDFEYFLRLQMKSDFSHTPGGLLWFCLPISLLVAVIYHVIVKKYFLLSLPNFFRDRLGRYASTNWLNYLVDHYVVVIFSILIGAASHIYWDAFTHETGFMVKQFPILQTEMTLGSFQIPMFKIFQHLSSVIGMLCIGLTLYYTPKFRTNQNAIASSFWSYSILLTVFFVGAKILYGMDFTQPANLIIHGISFGILSVLLVAIYYNLLRPQNK